MNSAEILRTAMDYMLCHVHTAIPGYFDSYDADRRLAVVHPAVKRRYADGQIIALPAISNVPVHFPGSAAASVTWKIAKGDPCLLVFQERSIERVVQLGGVQEPGADRRHDLNDAIAIPGDFTGLPGKPGADGKALDLRGDKVRIFLDGTTLRMADGAGGIITAQNGKVALGGNAGEALDLIAQALTKIATSNCVDGSPLTLAADISALVVQLQSITAAL